MKSGLISLSFFCFSCFADTKISRDTVMIGEAHNYFVCTNPPIYNLDTTRYTLDAVALVFARDNQNNEGT